VRWEPSHYDQRPQLNADPLGSSKMPACEVSLQYAEFDHDQVDERGAATSNEILSAFDAFDWRQQVETANRLQKCSPTFSVRDIDSDRLLWVSGTGDPQGISFINAYTYQGEVRRFLGLFRSRGSVAAPTHELTLQEARRAVELFVRGEHEALLKHLAC
jgi:hypothetical protein